MSSPAELFDGIHPVPIHGSFDVHLERLVFWGDKEGSKEFSISIADIISLSEEGSRFRIEFRHSNRTQQEAILFESKNLYQKIRDLRRQDKNILTGIHMLPSLPTLLLLASLFPAVGFVYYFLFYQSYRFTPRSVDTALGNQVVKVLLKQKQVCDNPDAHRFVKSILQTLRPKDSQFNYHTHIIVSNDKNAFALPGGQLILTSALLQESLHPRMVMGILAHEIAHVEKRHGIQSLIRGIGFGALVSLLLSTGLGQTAGIEIIAEATNTLLFLKYSRNFEIEADRAGVEILHIAGFSINGLNDFFEDAQRSEVHGKVSSYLSTHPSHKKRSQYFSQVLSKEKKGYRQIQMKKERWNIIQSSCKAPSS